MNNSGFYKKEDSQILYAPNIVEGPNYVLSSADKDSYTYPIDGWIWAENLDGAIIFFANNLTQLNVPFEVLPEGYFLATEREDENEFNKLATLAQLMISQGKLLPTTEVKIKDSNGQPHMISVSRFLDVISDYGMFCFLSRG